jgi:hypothetical protein
VIADAEMHGYLYYSAFQSHSLPGIQMFTEPPATICAHRISHQVARWLLRNLPNASEMFIPSDGCCIRSRGKIEMFCVIPLVVWFHTNSSFAIDRGIL